MLKSEICVTLLERGEPCTKRVYLDDGVPLYSLHIAWVKGVYYAVVPAGYNTGNVSTDKDNVRIETVATSNNEHALETKEKLNAPHVDDGVTIPGCGVKGTAVGVSAPMTSETPPVTSLGRVHYIYNIITELQKWK